MNNSPDTPAPQAPEATKASVGMCSRCGRPGAGRMGDELICDECYVACGSCCAEWFQDDS